MNTKESLERQVASLKMLIEHHSSVIEQHHIWMAQASLELSKLLKELDNPYYKLQ